MKQSIIQNKKQIRRNKLWVFALLTKEEIKELELKIFITEKIYEIERDLDATKTELCSHEFKLLCQKYIYAKIFASDKEENEYLEKIKDYLTNLPKKCFGVVRNTCIELFERNFNRREEMETVMGSIITMIDTMEEEKKKGEEG